MDQLFARCAGLDVHKSEVVACMRTADGGQPKHQIAKFPTTTKALLAMVDWLHDQGCTHVAMEATGVYWKPVWHLLEGHFELTLGNATEIKNVPGRKTDIKDAQWIADLLAHGLIRPSFVPPTSIQEVRELTRTRKQTVQDRGRQVQRIQKILDDANVRATEVISDLAGKTGRTVIRALIAGETDPEQLANLCGRLHASRAEIVEALRGRINQHHRRLLKIHLELIESLDAAIAEIEDHIEAALRPFRRAYELLLTVPGVQDTSAATIISEIGVDMSRFPTAQHLVSWARLCPRADESAGKRRSRRIRKGNRWLKPVLVQCAWSAVRKKEGYLRAQFLRLKSRAGAKKAIVAVAASMLTAIHVMLRDGVPYRDLGTDYYSRRDKARVAQRLTRRLRELGFQVHLEPAA